MNRKRGPNILVAIADDQGWPHASAYGCRFVRTPAFDRVAAEGVLFTNAFCPAPSCSPSRAGLLTGRNPWQLEEGGVLWSLLPARYRVYTDLLEAAGYHVGHTYKGWGPGSVELSGRSRNPAGPGWNRRKTVPPAAAMSRNDYAANFADFLEARPEGAPFCFWYGSKEPHRPYESGSGLRAGKRLEDVELPPYLPDSEEVRSDLLDYALEIEWSDEHLGRMLALLEERGELDDTLVVVTGDNGFPFPRAKANLYEQGMHVPMAIRWGARTPGSRTVTDFVSFIDLAPTFLEAAGLTPPEAMTGKSLLRLLTCNRSGRIEPGRDHVLTGRERHAYCRPGNTGYPCRAIRTDDFIYIRNFLPERWPAGDPPAYGDVDGSPTKHYMIEHRDDEHVRPLYELAFGKRPAEELYVITDGYACMKNLAADPAYAEVRTQLRRRLEDELRRQGDPRIVGGAEVFDASPYVPLLGKDLTEEDFVGLQALRREGLLDPGQ
ncbi:MAG: sulfatase [Kiritimatiellaeota bacterium]|nr:sulfatase [Kiritimatiellota bacterium]